ncbi:MAG: UvrD-helicase domain-containing protein [Dehalococcoidia bacterium]
MNAEREAFQRADDEARRHIKEQLAETLFVEAGAGTGKTRALVDRFVALVASGKRVEELVAITFTEKAAAELRDRVRAELEQMIAANDDPRLVRARDSLDRAQISTIHAFCANVLRSLAAENGIDPSFKVQDQVAAQRRFEAQWVTYLDRLAGDEKAHAAFTRVQELGLYTRDLERLAEALWENPAFAQQLEAEPLEAEPFTWPDFTAMRRRLSELHPERAFDGDALRTYVIELGHGIDELIESPLNERHTRLIAVNSTLKDRLGQTGRKGSWVAGVSIDAARTVATEVGADLKRALMELRSEALGAFLPYVVTFANEDARSRSRGGELVFEDLILQVRNILADHGARRRLRGRYAAMLIDEFQDTDPLQTEIAFAFAVDPDTNIIEPGRLFLVGDPKQSIYRFRRADMAVYSRTREDLRHGGGLEEQLALNRRSHARVLGFVNGVFEGLIGSGDNPWLQPEYRPVHPYRDIGLTGPGVALIGGALDRKAAEAKRHEAQQVAAYCRAILDQGWEAADRPAGDDAEYARPARYRDIAILLPTRTILAPLERALAEAGVPYRIEGGSLVYATQEVRDLINCLSAIDDPTDEVAVVGALRSPAYSCSDVELAQHRLGGGVFDYTNYYLDAEQGRVAASLLHLRTFHQLRSKVSIATLVERYVADRRVVEAGLYTSGSRDAFRRARFVIEQARLFEADQPESLRAFVDWLERRTGDKIYDYEGAGFDDDEDAVRIMTVHAAKGLEFPIVILAGLGVSKNNNPPTLLADRHTNRLAVTIGSDNRNNRSSLGEYETVKKQERDHDDAERIRLLYVAMTRARDHLVVSLYRAQKANSTFRHLLDSQGVGFHAPALPELPAVQVDGGGPFGGLEVDPVLVSEEAFIQERAALTATARGQRFSSATALGRLNHDEDEEKEREDETEPWARGRAGTHRGRAVHAALQVLPWDADNATIEALARAQAVVEAVPDDAPVIAELLRRGLSTGAATRARTARRALREVPFAFMQDDVLLEGFVDLVIESESGGLEIVDWKTDNVAGAAVEERLASYHLQAGLYVLGLEAATGRRVERVTYVFITAGEELSPGEPASLAAEAREAIVRFATA